MFKTFNVSQSIYQKNLKTIPVFLSIEKNDSNTCELHSKLRKYLIQINKILFLSTIDSIKSLINQMIVQFNDNAPTFKQKIAHYIGNITRIAINFFKNFQTKEINNLLLYFDNSMQKISKLQNIKILLLKTLLKTTKIFDQHMSNMIDLFINTKQNIIIQNDKEKNLIMPQEIIISFENFIEKISDDILNIISYQ